MPKHTTAKRKKSKNAAAKKKKKMGNGFNPFAKKKKGDK